MIIADGDAPLPERMNDERYSLCMMPTRPRKAVASVACRALLWLGLGAVITVAVSWAMAFTPACERLHTHGFTPGSPVRILEKWPMRLPKGSERIDYNNMPIREQSLTGITLVTAGMWLPEGWGGDQVDAFLFGIPFRSMAYVSIAIRVSPLDPTRARWPSW